MTITPTPPPPSPSTRRTPRRIAAAHAACGVLLAMLLAACSTAPSSSSAGAHPKVYPASLESADDPRRKGRSDSPVPFADLNQVSSDPTYGFTRANPVKMGRPTYKEGFVHESLYLNALRGPTGRPIDYRYLGMCCLFDSPNGPHGRAMLEVFELQAPGMDEPKRLYIDAFDPGTPQVPMGFSLRTAQRDVDKLKAAMPIVAAPEQQAQIENALRASPLLAELMGDAVADGRLTRIDVVGADRVQLSGMPSAFRAGVSGSTLRITQGLLKSLRAGCASRPQAPGALCPDDTVFVLAYLASIAKAGAAPDARPDTRPRAGTPKALEAAAFITAWNCVVDEATVRNGRTLEEPRVWAMMGNLRYGFALRKAARRYDAGVGITPQGYITPDPETIQRVGAALDSLLPMDIR